MQIGISISSCEWNIINQIAKAEGYKDGDAYVRCQIRKVSLLIPETKIITCPKLKKYFNLSDPMAIKRIEDYSNANTINPATLMRRLVVDPIIRKHLLEEVLVLQD